MMNMLITRKTVRTCVLAVVVLMLVGSVPLAGQENAVKVAQTRQQYVVGLRHDLHSNPEVRWTEEWTLGRIREEIGAITEEAKKSPNALNPRATLHAGKGGTWLDIDYNASFNRILFRADIDALPVTEATGLPFASKIAGKMHACGHDTHVSMLLGALLPLLRGDVLPVHNLRLVFQRAEENPVSKNGGETLVEEGVLDGISNVYGMHIWVGAPGKSGLFMSRPGPILANNDQFRVQVSCKGGHVAMPEDGCNAIEVASDIEHAMRGIDRRILGPFAPASIVPAVFLAGTSGQANVRPASTEMWFSARTFLDEAGRDALGKTLAEKIIAIAKGYNASVKVDFVKGYPATINTPEAVNRTSALLKSAGMKYEETEPSLGGEDFSYYISGIPEKGIQGRPGADFYLAAWQQGTGGHHSPTFNPDEKNLWMGTALWLLLATN